LDEYASTSSGELSVRMFKILVAKNMKVRKYAPYIGECENPAMVNLKSSASPRSELVIHFIDND